MYIVRDIFHLKFGHYKPVKTMVDDANQKGMLPKAKSVRFLTDFTGDSYRFIFETGYDNLADFEKELITDMGKSVWQDWYQRFMEHVDRGHREILKVVG